MRIAGRAFRPRAWAAALAACACAAAVLLGNWQRERAAERRAAEERAAAAAREPPVMLRPDPAAAAALAARRVRAHGRFAAEYTVLLEPRPHQGQAGYHVVQPLRLGESDWHVLVLRGWIAGTGRRERLPTIDTPQGLIAVEGIALPSLPRPYAAGSGDATDCPPAGAPCLAHHLEVEPFARHTGLALLPVVIEQHGGAADNLRRDWERREGAWRKNQMYALQWYALGGLAVALFLILSWRPENGPS